eukprot:9145737-Alexandrium_andersonii.AAC.1
MDPGKRGKKRLATAREVLQRKQFKIQRNVVRKGARPMTWPRYEKHMTSVEGGGHSTEQAT